MSLQPLEPSITVDVLHSADELLDRLSPRWSGWEEHPRAWIFRGQGNAVWGLIPAAFRTEQTFSCYPQKPFTIGKTHGDQIFEEMFVVQQFAGEVNRQGAQLPSEESYLWIGASEILTQKADPFDWPPSRVRPLFALAQHHGVPTRLLDWSERPFVAAYFAAIQAIECKSDRLSVWALNAGQAALYLGHHKYRSSGPILSVIKVPRGTNPNLRAQEGVFTLFREQRHLSDPPDLSPLEERLRSFVANEVAEGRAMDSPVIRKFDLPASEVGRLLRLLYDERVSATTLFPGYDGVVRGLRERHYWDRI